MTPTTPDPAQREAVARIVDPLPFKSWQALYDYCLSEGDAKDSAKDAADGFHLASMEEARSKADAILALLSASAPVAPALTADDVKAYARAWLDLEGGWGEWEKALDALIEERAPAAPAGGYGDRPLDDTPQEIIDRLHTDDQLIAIEEKLRRLLNICDASKSCMTPEGPARKAIVYNSMLSAIEDASWLAYAVRILKPALTPSSPSAAAPREVGDLRDLLRTTADALHNAATELHYRHGESADSYSKIAIDAWNALRTPPTAAPAGDRYPSCLDEYTLDELRAQAETYRYMHEIATKELGYESILEALEACQPVVGKVRMRSANGGDGWVALDDVAAFEADGWAAISDVVAAPAGDDAGLREAATALCRQVEAVIYRLNGQAYSSTRSALNAMDAALSASPAPQGDA